MSKPDTLIETDNVRVRIMTLDPCAKTALHRHTEVRDHMVCLSGSIRVHSLDPETMIHLSPGELCSIDVGSVHEVINQSDKHPARYLLIQGVGRYDFIVDEET